jgi:hypothetical protein
MGILLEVPLSKEPITVTAGSGDLAVFSFQRLTFVLRQEEL